VSAALLVLVPLLVLAVVGVLAFAGCAPFGTVDDGTGTTPDPPVDPPMPAAPLYPATILGGSEGLVAYWRLSDPPDRTVAEDAGPLHLDGSYRGQPAPTVGKPDGALTPRERDACAGFSGDGGHVEVPFNANLNPAQGLQFSVEVWARLRNPAAQGGAEQFLACSRFQGNDVDGTAGWELLVTTADGGAATFTGRVYTGVGNESTGADAVVPASAAADGAWHHVVLTFDGADGARASILTVTVRVAGATGSFEGRTETANYLLNVVAPLRLGAANSPLPSDFFDGDLDEVAFYNRALTAAQIEAHFRAAQGT
jgi:large repetitive protein